MNSWCGLRGLCFSQKCWLRFKSSGMCTLYRLCNDGFGGTYCLNVQCQVYLNVCNYVPADTQCDISLSKHSNRLTHLRDLGLAKVPIVLGENTPCRLVNIYSRFHGSYYIHLQDYAAQEKWLFTLCFLLPLRIRLHKVSLQFGNFKTPHTQFTIRLRIRINPPLFFIHNFYRPWRNLWGMEA
jgi:hypothetical protein